MVLGCICGAVVKYETYVQHHIAVTRIVMWSVFCDLCAYTPIDGPKQWVCNTHIVYPLTFVYIGTCTG